MCSLACTPCSCPCQASALALRLTDCACRRLTGAAQSLYVESRHAVAKWFGAEDAAAVDYETTTRSVELKLLSAGVNAACFFAMYAGDSIGTVPNELVQDRVAVSSRLLGIMSVALPATGSLAWMQALEEREHRRRESAVGAAANTAASGGILPHLRQLRAAVPAYGTIGIKMSHAQMAIELDDPLVDDMCVHARLLPRHSLR